MARVRVKVPVELKVIEVPSEFHDAVTNGHTGLQERPSSNPNEVPTAEVTNPNSSTQQVSTVVEAPVATPVTPQALPASEYSPRHMTFSVSRKGAIFAGIAFLITALFVTGIFVSRNRTDDTPKTLGASAVSNDAQKYYEIVSKYVELPTEELPTVANVSDAAKVRKENAVLTDVKDGDKMLFFAQSRKVIVFRPSTNKVVAVVSLTQPTNKAE